MSTGKGETRQGRQLGELVVLTLKEPLQSSGLGITVDNFFCSLSLACQLLLRNMTVLGSIKKNRREVPTEICCHLGKDLYFYGFFLPTTKSSLLHVSPRKIPWFSCLEARIVPQ